MKYTLIALLATSLLASCGPATKSDNGDGDAIPLLPITSSPENPNYITLRLVERTDNDTAFTYVARGIYNQDTVGFTVAVANDIPAGIRSDGSVDEEAGFKTGSFTFIRSGEESDRFVAALAELWNVDGVTTMQQQPIRPLVFSSNRETVDHEKRFTYSFKLFFQENAPVPGEVFFAYDTYKKTIEFQEKASEYRSQIVHAFAE